MAGDFRAIVDALQCGAPGCGCRKVGPTRATVHCPAHDDEHPSLTVTLSSTDKVLLKCQSQHCAQDAIISALRDRGLWSGDGSGASNPGHTASPARREVAAYDYRDEHGAVLFQVVRFEPKDFRQRRPDGAGGWTWNLNGVRRVPYRLPELLAARETGRRVYVVEGEKDVDRLLHIGCAATTNPGGAGKFRPEYAVYFKGARVAILPDHDAAGGEHARQVAQTLHGVAAEVKVLALPGLPSKGDVSDWLAQGHAPEELDRLAEDARPWRPPSAEGIPEHGYVGIAADFADLYAEFTESPRSFLYFTFLAYLGGLVAHRVTLHTELRPSPRLFLINLGASADARKSSSIDHVDRFFRGTIEGFGDCVHYGLGSAEGLARRLGRDPKTNAVRPLIVHLDEARVLTDKSRPEGSILLPMLATLFERTVFDNTTKTHTMSVRDGYVSLVAASTIETYATMWSSAFLDIGFTNRVWLVTGGSDRRIARPEPIPEDRRRAIASKLGDLLARIDQAAGTGQLVLRLDDEADRSWDAWYQAMPRTIHSRRLDTYGLRLMILLSLSRGDLDTVSADTVQRVTALLDHQLALRRQFDPVDAESTVARMEEVVRRELRARGPLTKRDLRRYVHADRFGLWMFETAVFNLMRAKDVQLDRAAKRYTLAAEAATDA